MPYRLIAGQPIASEVRRILLEEIDYAVHNLSGTEESDRDRRVHEARKSIKKLRALLRLIRPCLDNQVFGRENQRLRDFGRSLSELRDAKAITEVFESVIHEPLLRKKLTDEDISVLRTGLEGNRRSTEERVDPQETLRSAVTALRSVREDLGRMSFSPNGFKALEPGLSKVYQDGRKAMHRAQKHPTAANFHEWRKRVKDHWYHVRLLEELKTDLLTAREDDLKKLETWLGDDHNLVVLRQTLRSDGTRFGQITQTSALSSSTKEHSKELREKAMDLGHHLYDPKPKALLRELREARTIWPEIEADAQEETSASPSQYVAF